MARVDDFFLAEVDPTDDRTFRSPARDGITVRPLLDGVQAFGDMEVAIAKATSTVHVAMWVFNPDTPLQARAAVNAALVANARDRGVKKAPRAGTWGELLVAVARMGVAVRVILTDFDPILANGIHRSNWRAYFRLLSLKAGHAAATMEAIVSMHDARTSLFAESILSARLGRLITTINRKGPGAAHAQVANMPRLWRNLEWDAAAKRYTLASNPVWETFPASHHQKICIVDRTTAFCGGLDVNKGRVSTSRHTTTLWHDVHSRFDGQASADLDRAFLGRWNVEVPLFNAFISVADPTGRPLPARPATAPVPVPTAAVPSGPGKARAQVWRTLSRNGFGIVPTNVRADIREGYQRAIAHANHFVYIENQYVRDKRVAEWLVARRNETPELVVIMVVPVAPEEVSAPGGADEVTNDGLFLQHEVITALTETFGARFGVYSMAARAASPKPLLTDTNGSRQVYVHTKTMIVDDDWATIGSANANPRSFEVDTEAALSFFDPTAVKAYRLQLWGELLGAPAGMASWAPGDFLAKWNAIASSNAAVSPKDITRRRKGYIVPHDTSRFPGSSSLRVPDAFTELVDNDIEPAIVT